MKNILVTGCSKGIGFEIVKVFAKRSDIRVLAEDKTMFEIRGLVSGVVQGNDQLGGFYIQDARYFYKKSVFVNSSEQVSVGDEVLLNAISRGAQPESINEMAAIGGSITSIKLEIESTHPNKDVTYRFIVYNPVSMYVVFGLIEVDVELLSKSQ